MRIAVVTESFLPTVNGVTNSVCKVLDHLAARGHRAIVVAPDAGAPSSYAGFPVHPVPAVAYRQFPVGLPHPILQRVVDDFAPDVVHAASPFLLGAQALQAARRGGIASVAVFQTDLAGYTRRNRLSAMEPFAWWVTRLVHQAADLTLAPSTSSIADLEAARIGPLAMWGRGVDTTTYHPRNRADPAVQRIRTRLGADERVLVGYVGRLAPEKQVERLAALRGIEGMRLVVVGDGPSLPSVRAALRDLPVHFAGRLSGRALARAYASFDVFVHAGTEETFGQTVQEAHATGLPVVAPRAGGPIDLVDDGHDGRLFDPDTPDDASLHGAVAELVGDASMRARFGEAGRRRVLDRTWTAVGDELLGHYEAVIARRAIPLVSGS